MSTGPQQSHEEWYRATRPTYEGLARTAESLLRELLTIRGVEFLAVTSRAKTLDSFSGKLKRKKYVDPRTDITDLCGVRIITYLESDIARVMDVLREVFDIDEKHSLDKSNALEVDRVGYRSVHFVCGLGRRRTALPEYQSFNGLKFEIQIRTVLQHAWAQIEHDRNYKFSGVLPAPIQRRLYLAAGLLEIADREFSAIASEIDDYKAFVDERTAAGELDLEVTSTSLISYIETRFADIHGITVQISSFPQMREDVIEELLAFEIRTLSQLDALFTPDFFDAVQESYPPGEATTDIGIVRDAMMYHDFERYFAVAWQQRWDGLDQPAVEMFAKKFGGNLVLRVIRKHRVEIVNDETWEIASDEAVGLDR